MPPSSNSHQMDYYAPPMAILVHEEQSPPTLWGKTMQYQYPPPLIHALGYIISIVVGIRLYQPIQFIHHLTITHNYHPDTTHAGTVLIGGFEIYCSETFHLSMILYHFIQSFFIQDFLRNKASPMSKTLSNIFRS